MYKKLVWTTFRNNTVYKLNLLLSIVAAIISVLAVRQVWKVLYGSHASGGQVAGITLEEMLTYVTVAMVLRTFYRSSIAGEISQKIQTGEIVQDFQRPWDFQIAMFSRSLGIMLAGVLSIVVPIAIMTVLIFPIQFPHTVNAWAGFLVSLLFGLGISFCLQFFIGLMAFVFVEVWGFEIVLGLTISFLSGQMLPLKLFPDFLREWVNYLPFRGLYDIPVSIFTNQIQGIEVWGYIGFQAIWVIILGVIIRLLINYFERLLVVAGG
ncbi:ABC transporter permease [Priestia koreensis]|uniref:ABC transporter permease n=1 Tax=Priestia koreensis TaxID=284581 RepID=UPI003D038D25